MGYLVAAACTAAGVLLVFGLVRLYLRIVEKG